jgi:hypothetical protein
MNEGSGSTQLERLQRAESFHPTRPLPPIPENPVEKKDMEESSHFSSDSDNGSHHSLRRVFSFTRGASQRYSRSPPAIRGRSRTPAKREDGFVKHREESARRQELSGNASVAATRAIAASSSSRREPLAQFNPAVRNDESPSNRSRETLDDLLRRGQISVAEKMHENVKRSTQGRFLGAGSLRKSKEDVQKDKRNPSKSNSVARQATLQLKRQDTKPSNAKEHSR